MKWTAGLLVWAAICGPVLAESECRPDRLQLRWDKGSEIFSVEVADDAAERGRGLMFRESLGLGAGMLFVYASPQSPKFWMKNTLIPLDMIFADMSGTVTHVHADAVPGDLTPIPGGDGVGFVLEINGGLAAKLGIVPGAEIRHPAVPQGTAAWPCDG